MSFVEAFAALHPEKAPRILTVDLERVPGRVTLDIFDAKNDRNAFIAADRWDEYPRTICASFKWYDERKVGFVAEWESDEPYFVARRCWELIDAADWLISFNGRRADLKWLRTEWLLAGLPMPTPWKDIDLYAIARRQFAFESKSLAHLCSRLGLPGKLGHYDPDVARAAVAGDERAQRSLARYNRRDVVITEQAYHKLRPFIVPGPNWGLFTGHGSRVCPTCGANRMTRQKGTQTAITGRYEVWRCDECGSLARESKRSVSTPTRGL